MAVKERPAPVTVTAILNLVFGLGGLLCTLCAGVGLLGVGIMMNDPASIPPQNKDSFEMLDELWTSLVDHVPAIQGLLVGSMVLSLFTSLLLVISGIGLLGVRKWGRSTALTYCAIAILANASSVVYQVAVMEPNMERVQSHMSNWAKETGNPEAMKAFAQPTRSDPLASAIQSICCCGLFSLYPFLVLILLYLPSARAAFEDRDDHMTPPPGQGEPPPFPQDPAAGHDTGYEPFPYDNKDN